jgi:uncharacterized spore protein YtfJ
MDDMMGQVRPMLDKSLENLSDTLDRLMVAARPGAVFGQPVEAGGYTVITASEVTTGGGFGSGVGVGGPQASGSQGASSGPGAGGGSGGGGGSMGRPVAVIAIGPDGVTVKPVFDITKLGVVLLTAWGSVALTAVRMARFRRW